MCTGARYLGGYTRDDVSKFYWLKNCTEKWERDIRAIRKTANKYSQESYAAVDRVVQPEWIFWQHATKDTGQEFMETVKVLWETYLPLIFFGKPKTLSPIVGALSKFPVKKSRMVQHNPVTSEKDKYASSLRAIGGLIGGVKGDRFF